MQAACAWLVIAVMPDRLKVSLVIVPRAERPLTIAEEPARRALTSRASSAGDPVQALSPSVNSLKTLPPMFTSTVESDANG